MTELKEKFSKQNITASPGRTVLREIGEGSLSQLAMDIERAYSRLSKASHREKVLGIQGFLDEKLAQWEPGKKRQIIEHLRDYFEEPISPTAFSTSLKEVARMILGPEALDALYADDAEVLERLQMSLSTVFNTINQIVQSLHGVSGPAGKLTADRTIRMLISDRLSSEADTGNLPIQAYLDHIKEAFGYVKEAIEETLQDKIKEMLHEISPEQLVEELGKRALKLGPLYKAALFDRFEKKYSHVSLFVDQGFFTREVMLSFERKFGEKLSGSSQTRRSEGIGTDES